MRRLSTGVLALVATIALAGSANAAVSYDAATGTGFVGKGDLQLLFGWNNTAVQRNADAVQFRALSFIETRQDFTCKLRSGLVRPQFLTTYTDVDNILVSVMRDNKKQVTGFKLQGFGPDYPASVYSFYSGPCTGVRTAVGDPYIVEDITDLYAVHNDVSALLTITPPVL